MPVSILLLINTLRLLGDNVGIFGAQFDVLLALAAVAVPVAILIVVVDGHLRRLSVLIGGRFLLAESKAPGDDQSDSHQDSGAGHPNQEANGGRHLEIGEAAGLHLGRQ